MDLFYSTKRFGKKYFENLNIRKRVQDMNSLDPLDKL